MTKHLKIGKSSINNLELCSSEKLTNMRICEYRTAVEKNLTVTAMGQKQPKHHCCGCVCIVILDILCNTLLPSVLVLICV